MGVLGKLVTLPIVEAVRMEWEWSRVDDNRSVSNGIWILDCDMIHGCCGEPVVVVVAEI